MRYRTIVADPPWRYGNQKGAVARGHARRHYETMSTEDICSLPVSELAEGDAHLWVWCVNALIEDAHRVVRAWGFTPLNMVTWCKRQPGVGYYLRTNTEHLIFATRGKPMVPASKPLATWFVWPRAEHSRKPEASYDLIEQVSPGPRLEMFSRRARLGWDTWGNESLNHVELPDVA